MNKTKGCKVCLSRVAELGLDGRCRLCRDVKAATDAGMSYGRFKAVLYEKYGEMWETPPNLYHTCPECGKIVPFKHGNQIYCSVTCQKRRQQRKWAQRKREKEAYGTNTTN